MLGVFFFNVPLPGHLFLETVSVRYLDFDWTDFDHMTNPAPPPRPEKQNIALVHISLFNTQQSCFDILH